MTCLFSQLDTPPAAKPLCVYIPTRVYQPMPPVDSLRSRIAAQLWTYPDGMTTAELAANLHAPEAIIESRLFDLRRDGFATCEGATWRHTGGAK